MTTLTCRASAFSFSNNLRTASSAPTDGSIGVVRTLIFQTLRFSFVATRSVNVPPMSIPTLTVFPATISFPCLLTNQHRWNVYGSRGYKRETQGLEDQSPDHSDGSIGRSACRCPKIVGKREG